MAGRAATRRRVLPSATRRRVLPSATCRRPSSTGCHRGPLWTITGGSRRQACGGKRRQGAARQSLRTTPFPGAESHRCDSLGWSELDERRPRSSPTQISGALKERNLRMGRRRPHPDDIAALGVHQERVKSVAFSGDGRLLASADFGGLVKIWEVKSRRLLWEFELGSGFARELAFHPRKTWLATAGYDGKIGIVDVVARTELRFFEHPGWVRSVQFIDDGERIVTLCADGTLRFWNVEKAGPPSEKRLNYALFRVSKRGDTAIQFMIRVVAPRRRAAKAGRSGMAPVYSALSWRGTGDSAGVRSRGK